MARRLAVDLEPELLREGRPGDAVEENRSFELGIRRDTRRRLQAWRLRNPARALRTSEIGPMSVIIAGADNRLGAARLREADLHLDVPLDPEGDGELRNEDDREWADLNVDHRKRLLDQIDLRLK